MDKRILKGVVFIVPVLVLIGYAGFKVERVADRGRHHDHSDHYHEHSHSEDIMLQAAFVPTRYTYLPPALSPSTLAEK